MRVTCSRNPETDSVVFAEFVYPLTTLTLGRRVVLGTISEKKNNKIKETVNERIVAMTNIFEEIVRLENRPNHFIVNNAQVYSV